MTLWEYLKRNKKSMRKFAKENNINVASISLHINGKKTLSARDIAKIKDTGIDATMEIAQLDDPMDIYNSYFNILILSNEKYFQLFILDSKEQIKSIKSGRLYVFQENQLDELRAYLDFQNKKYRILRFDFYWEILFTDK